ncbi:MAG: SPFH domain-containing protein [Pedobacter sp.]
METKTQIMKHLFTTASVCLLAFSISSCDRAQSNVQTLYTSNCGVSWKLIKAGETLPKGIGMCSYKVTVPDYPMQGESIFKSAFKNRVMAKIEVTYDYSILDAIKYVGEAKYLGKINSDSDDEVNSSKAYETAENSVIDKRIKEVARDLLISEDIVDFSQAEFETKLLESVNELLKAKGVKINFLSFVPIPEEQTRQAIDVVTAMKIYESKGLTEVGKSVTSARAGATKVEVTVQKEDKPVVED